MEHLRSVMSIIDQHADKLPEGAYLEVCNHLQHAYKERNKIEMATIIDYENFDIVLNDQPDNVLDHFYDYYYNISIMSEESFLLAQKRYLHAELNSNEPLRRISKTAYEISECDWSSDVCSSDLQSHSEISYAVFCLRSEERREIGRASCRERVLRL